MGFPGGTKGKQPSCQSRRYKTHKIYPWVRKIPWRRGWQPTPVSLPGESHGQRSLAGYIPQGCTVICDWSDLACIYIYIYIYIYRKTKTLKANVSISFSDRTVFFKQSCLKWPEWNRHLHIFLCLHFWENTSPKCVHGLYMHFRADKPWVVEPASEHSEALLNWDWGVRSSCVRKSKHKGLKMFRDKGCHQPSSLLSHGFGLLYEASLGDYT